jgi:hypothetical protein
MNTTTKQCAECTHFDYDVDKKIATCALKHMVIFYQPTGPLDYSYGWKRRCPDYLLRAISIENTVKKHLSQVIEVKEMLEAERERCAKVCDEYGTAESCAKAIRALGDE